MLLLIVKDIDKILKTDGEGQTLQKLQRPLLSFALWIIAVVEYVILFIRLEIISDGNRNKCLSVRNWNIKMYCHVPTCRTFSFTSITSLY
jgi:hypothetical protein